MFSRKIDKSGVVTIQNVDFKDPPGLFKVRAHTKTYKKGHKPKKMPDGNWAVINENKKPKKQAWLQEAWKIVRKKQDPTTRKLLQKTLYIAP